MRRSDLEHLIRAAGSIAGERELVIIGSQSVLGQFPQAPLALLMSMEADLYPRAHPELAERVDGAIGEGSAFHQARPAPRTRCRARARWEVELRSVDSAILQSDRVASRTQRCSIAIA